MFLQLTHQNGDTILINTTRILFAHEGDSGVALRMSNGDSVNIRGTLADLARKLDSVRLS